MKLWGKIIVAILAFALSYLLVLFVINRLATGSEESTFTHTVSRVIDGDTVEMADGSKVRLAGIDTPERGECGFDEARLALEALVLEKRVALTPSGQEDTDKYGRLIRYVDFEKGKGFSDDAGFLLIEKGLAKARYDSRDGYGEHKRQDIYVFTDAAVEDKC